MSGCGERCLVIRNTFLDLVSAGSPSSDRFSGLAGRRCVSEGFSPRTPSDRSFGLTEPSASDGTSTQPQPSKAHTARRGRRGSGRSKAVELASSVTPAPTGLVLTQVQCEEHQLQQQPQRQHGHTHSDQQTQQQLAQRWEHQQQSQQGQGQQKQDQGWEQQQEPADHDAGSAERLQSLSLSTPPIPFVLGDDECWQRPKCFPVYNLQAGSFPNNHLDFQQGHGLAAIRATQDKADVKSLAAIPKTPSGKFTSIGSVHHSEGRCSPCLYWARSQCCKGMLCEYCHIEHKGQRSRRIRASKATRTRRHIISAKIGDDTSTTTSDK